MRHGSFPKPTSTNNSNVQSCRTPMVRVTLVGVSHPCNQRFVAKQFCRCYRLSLGSVVGIGNSGSVRMFQDIVRNGTSFRTAFWFWFNEDIRHNYSSLVDRPPEGVNGFRLMKDFPLATLSVRASVPGRRQMAAPEKPTWSLWTRHNRFPSSGNDRVSLDDAVRLRFQRRVGVGRRTCCGRIGCSDGRVSSGDRS